MASRGEAADYYGDEQQPQQQQPPQQYRESKSGYAPPTYGQNFNSDSKQDFAQTFKIEKPKLNDLWAGILVQSTPPSSTVRSHAD